jgi:hypothetical protein
MSVRAQQISNVYEPKEKRLQKKIEAQRTHFNIGGRESKFILTVF